MGVAMNDPLISVIIPAYASAGVISRAIDSALAQDVALEVIVVNDGSPDDMDAAMARYEGNLAVTYVKNEKNLGPAESRNKGIELARGAFIAFLDADDYWAEGKLTKQLAALERDGTVLCATARELMRPDGASTGRVFPVPETVTYGTLLKHNCISCSSVLLRADVAREFPMHNADSHEDYIMWLEILRKYQKASGVNEALTKYTVSNTGKSGSKWKSAKMTFKVYRYMGFGLAKSCACFCSYAAHGVKKYYFSR